MIDDAKAARQQVIELINSGSSRDEALNQLINDQIFDEWYSRLKTELEKLI